MSDTWDLTPDCYLPLMSADNQEFMVFGVLGPPGAGKSTILNEIYGFDSSAQGVLPPFNTQTEEVRAMARHCSVGLELRMCAERIILLDTQPVFSASVLVDLMRPNGTSNTPVMGGETMSAELAHEIMELQLGEFLFSVCHVVLLITEGVDDISMWRYMRTIEMLKQGIPDPTVVAQGPSATDTSGDKDRNDNDEQIENFADAVFVHTNKRRRVVLLAPGSFNPSTYMHLRMFELGMDALTTEGYHVLGGYMSGCLVVLLSTSAWDRPAPMSNQREDLALAQQARKAAFIYGGPLQALRENVARASALGDEAHLGAHMTVGREPSSSHNALPFHSKVKGNSRFKNEGATVAAGHASPAGTRKLPCTAQLTVFYKGMVNVYEDVLADKAQAIMLLAGTRSGWSSSNYMSFLRKPGANPGRPFPTPGDLNHPMSRAGSPAPPHLPTQSPGPALTKSPNWQVTTAVELP